MAKTQVMLSVEKVTDCETGDYHIGELDFGVHLGPLTSYLEQYGYEGKRSILAMLGHLAYQVETYFRELTRSDESAVESKTQ